MRPFLLVFAVFAAVTPLRDAQTLQLTNREPSIYTLADLFSHADKVVLAQIIAGDSETYDIPLYKAHVIQAFKGASNGDTFFFGPYTGVQIGSQYFLFLENAPTPIAPKSKPGAGFGVVPYLQVFDEGYSSMQSGYQCVFPGAGPEQQCANAVRVCTDYIKLPKALATFTREPNPPFGCQWVRKDAFTTALGDLAQP